ncbi:hypothetical protein [Ekhidna sp.]|uniref:hypothetical protein n=1 Tax=Ekhidna sp. TaxID=2608089 RepID=UPI003296DE33
MKAKRQKTDTSRSGRKLVLSKYRTYLKEKLSSVYKNYFPFEELSPLDHYLNEEGVYAEQDHLGNPRIIVQIKMNPLRIEVQELASHTRRVVWQMIGG